jgi:hypothetical protein
MKSENLEQTFLCCIVSERQAVWLVVFLHKQKFNKQEEGCFRTFGHQMNVTRNYFIFCRHCMEFQQSLSLSLYLHLPLAVRHVASCSRLLVRFFPGFASSII